MRKLLIIIMLLISATPNHPMPALLQVIGRFAGVLGKSIAVDKLKDVINDWFSPEKIQQHGETECLARVEAELQKISTTLATQQPATTSIAVHSTQSVHQDNAIHLVNNASSTAAVKALGKAVDSRFKDVSSKLATIVTQQTELLTLNKTAAAHATKIKQIHDSIQKNYALIGSLTDSVHGLSMIAEICGDRKLSHQIERTGASFVKIADSALVLKNISTQVAAGNMTASAASVAAAGGWIGIAVGIAGMITSLCNDDEQSNGFQAILDAIGQLSKQMHEYHMATMQAFAGVHEHLHAQDRFMLENFFELRTGQYDIKQKLQEMSRIARRMNYAMRGNVGYVSDLLQSHHQQMTGNLESLRVEGILDLVQESALLCKERHVPTEAYKQYLSKLFVKGVSRAKEPYVTGNADDETSPTAVCLALSSGDWQGNLWTHPAFNKVNLIRKYGKRFFQMPHESVVNPLIWAHCADAIAQLVSKKIADPQYPQDEQAKENDLKVLTEMEDAGNQFVGFSQALGQKIDSMAQDYAQSIDELTAHVQSEVQAHEAKRTQELQTEVAKKNNEEMAQFGNAAASCPNGVRITNEAVALMSRQNVQVNANGKACVVRPRAYCDDVVTDYARTPLTETDKEKLVEVCHTKKPPINYDAFLVQEKKKHLEKMQQKTQTLLPLCAISITQDANALVAQKANFNSVSKVMIPKPGCGCGSILPVPFGIDQLLFSELRLIGEGEQYEAMMTKIKEYALREQRGFGFIHYEYEPKPGFFTICAYFTERSGQKFPILTIQDRSFKPESFYTIDENVLTWWYGQRYPKTQDQINTTGFKIGLIVPKMIGKAKTAVPKKCYYYPPIEGYQPAKDVCINGRSQGTVCTATPQADLAQRTTAAQAKERIVFNNKLVAQAQPSTNSKVFKALQNMDMRHKVLDCALMLAYNEAMFTQQKLRKEFADFYATSNETVGDITTTLKYLESYSAPASAAALRPYELPQLLQRTKQSKMQALQSIKGLKLMPQCAKVSSIVSRLAQLRQTYASRVMPVPAVVNATAASATATGATAAQVAALQADNKKLADMVNGLQQQMAAMLALLQKQSK